MDQDELFALADKAYDEERFEEAFELFRQGAEAGDTSAMISLANMYTGGAGMPVCDYAEAIRWEMKALEAGDALAMGNLGISFRTLGDIRKAKEWFEKALESGNDDAALELAKLYMVSEKETEKILKYLHAVIDGGNVCEASVDEARDLLAEFHERSAK